MTIQAFRTSKGYHIKATHLINDIEHEVALMLDFWPTKGELEEFTKVAHVARDRAIQRQANNA